MDHTENPYTPPFSDLADLSAIPGSQQRSVYSPVQGALASFLGGPFVGTYFIAMNFKALDKPTKMRRSIIWGLLFSAVLVFGSPFLPVRTPKFIIPLAYSWVVRLVIEKSQFSKEQINSSGTLKFESNWKVFGLSLLSLLVFLFSVVGLILLYSALGLIPDA